MKHHSLVNIKKIMQIYFGIIDNHYQ